MATISPGRRRRNPPRRALGPPPPTLLLGSSPKISPAGAPRAWEKAFEVNPSESEAVRASCVEFVLAGLYASDRIPRSQEHGRITYEIR